MMTETEVEDRTEAPTPRRLREARKKGQVAVSRDLAAALALLATAGGLHLLGPWLMAGLRAGLGRSLSGLHEMNSAEAAVSALGLGGEMMGAAAPILVFALAAGVLATLTQVGFIFTTETLKLQPDRLDPLGGFRRAFSMQTFVGIAGGLAKGAVILGILAASLWQERATLAGLSTRPLSEGLAVLTGSAAALFTKTALALLALGVVDWAYRRWQHLRDLRMSRREVQDELREFDGDPEIKRRRRSHHAQLDETRMLAHVPGALAVVTDDGDVAVALGGEGGTPVVLAKARGAVADRIRETALGHGIPVLERADLARGLNRRGKSGSEVPSGLREGAAEVLAVAREMKGNG